MGSLSGSRSSDHKALLAAAVEDAKVGPRKASGDGEGGDRIDNEESFGEEAGPRDYASNVDG